MRTLDTSMLIAQALRGYVQEAVTAVAGLPLDALFRVARELLRARGLEVAPASGGAISVAPLLPGVRGGLRFVREGPMGVSIRGRIGALIAAEAGALVRAETGEPFPEDVRVPARALLVAADEPTLATLRDAVAAGS